MVQMVEGMDPGESFLMYGNGKGKIVLQDLHNQHHTMLQNMVYLNSYKIWAFKNMQTIRWSILWPVHNINACHTVVWTIYDIHATIHHHIWFIIYFLFFVSWSIPVWLVFQRFLKNLCGSLLYCLVKLNFSLREINHSISYSLCDNLAIRSACDNNN